MLLLLGYNMDAYDCLYTTVWICMLVPVFFIFLKGEDREKTDSRHRFLQKQSLSFLEQREREVIAKSLGKPGFKVHTLCIWVSVRCGDSGHGDSATRLCLKLS